MRVGLVAHWVRAAIEHPERLHSLTSIMSTTGEPTVGTASDELLAEDFCNDVFHVVCRRDHALNAKRRLKLADAEATLADLGLCFLFAQKHHPALARIAPIRKSLARRTIFNLLGPLANPARVTRQLVGIARPAYVPIYAEAIARLGTERTFVVSGDEGLDELSLAGDRKSVV